MSGKAEHGKTLAANILKSHCDDAGLKSIIVSFASYVKFISKQYFGWDGKKDEQGRAILQLVGTDIARKIEPDFWVNSMWDFIRVFCKDYDYVFIDDVRFPNEINFFFNNGIPAVSVNIFRLDFESSLTEKQKRHLSETALDNATFDIRIKSNSGRDNLGHELEKYLNYILGIDTEE